jgi:hypothetical protein
MDSRILVVSLALMSLRTAGAFAAPVEIVVPESASQVRALTLSIPAGASILSAATPPVLAAPSVSALSLSPSLSAAPAAALPHIAAASIFRDDRPSRWSTSRAAAPRGPDVLPASVLPTAQDIEYYRNVNRVVGATLRAFGADVDAGSTFGDRLLGIHERMGIAAIRFYAEMLRGEKPAPGLVDGVDVTKYLWLKVRSDGKYSEDDMSRYLQISARIQAAALH